MTTIEKKVYESINSIIEEKSLKLYDVIYKKEGREYYLKIFLEKPSGKVDLDECEKISRILSDYLDEKDLIKEQYFLEVSSSGLEKHIRLEEHYKEAINKEIEISLYMAIEGNKNIKGILNSFDEEAIVVDDVKIERKNISSINRTFDWNKIMEEEN